MNFFDLSERLVLPVIGAPMFMVSVPELVIAIAKLLTPFATHFGYGNATCEQSNSSCDHPNGPWKSHTELFLTVCSLW